MQNKTKNRKNNNKTKQNIVEKTKNKNVICFIQLFFVNQLIFCL